MNNEDELDDGLHRLFADERLALRPTSDAHRLIVAGAKRARRRMEVALGAGSAAAVLVIVGGLVLASPRLDRDQQVASPHLTPGSETSEVAPSTSQSPSKTYPSPPPAVDSPPPDQLTRSNPSITKRTPSGTDEPALPESFDMPYVQSNALGPDGYGKLKLGMSFREAKESGVLADPNAAAPQGCTGYELAEGREFVFEVTFSENTGLSVISASGAKTPEGIGVGSPREEVETAYPKHTKDESGYFVDTGAGGFYRLVITEGEAVEAFLLVRDKQDCGDF